MMEYIDFRKSNLLIDDYDECEYKEKDFIKKILYNDYISIDKDIPICRFRGNLIRVMENKNLELICWQRNVSRIKRMDVSLPTIIKIKLNSKEEIFDINLDNSFKGSKGLFCSQKYLDKIIKNSLLGAIIDKDFLKKIKTSNMHCFHINEVLGGLYTYYNLLKDKISDLNKLGEIYFDEEITDSYIENNNLIVSGIQIVKGYKSLNYAIMMEDIFDKIVFQKNGFLRVKDRIKTKFYIEGILMFEDFVTPSSKDYSYIGLTRVLTRCLKNIKDYMGYGKKIKILNSNVYQASFIGLLVQALSIRLYKNSYDYTMHMITSVQRPNNVPLCIGAINDEDDGMKFFPKFNVYDII